MPQMQTPRPDGTGRCRDTSVELAGTSAGAFIGAPARTFIPAARSSNADVWVIGLALAG